MSFRNVWVNWSMTFKESAETHCHSSHHISVSNLFFAKKINFQTAM